MNIVRDTVNYLGSIGSGKTFDETEWEGKYKSGDPFGFEKNIKAVVYTQVTAIICTGKWLNTRINCIYKKP